MFIKKIVASRKNWCYKIVLKISQAKNTILDAFKDRSSYWVKFVLSEKKIGPQWIKLSHISSCKSKLGAKQIYSSSKTEQPHSSITKAMNDDEWLHKQQSQCSQITN